MREAIAVIFCRAAIMGLTQRDIQNMGGLKSVRNTSVLC